MGEVLTVMVGWLQVFENFGKLRQGAESFLLLKKEHEAEMRSSRV